MKIISIICITLAIFVSGCTTYQRYDYKAPKINMEYCDIIINLEGWYHEDSLIWGAPYALQFWIDVPVDKELIKVVVKDISLIGQESNIKYEFESTTGREPRLDSETKTLGTVASVTLDSKDFSYESYLLKATVALYLGQSENIVIKKIEVLLELNSSKDRHWNWFDKIMSV